MQNIMVHNIRYRKAKLESAVIDTSTKYYYALHLVQVPTKRVG